MMMIIVNIILKYDQAKNVSLAMLQLKVGVDLYILADYMWMILLVIHWFCKEASL